MTLHIHPDMTAEEIEKIKTQYTENLLITPDTLYVDMWLLRDYVIGAAMTYILEDKDITRSKARFAYIREQSVSWAKRYHHDIEHYLPDLKITNQQIRDRLYDPRYTDFIYNASPILPSLDLIDRHIDMNANHSAVAGKIDSIVMTVNTYPLPLTPHIIKSVRDYLPQRLGVNVRVVSIDPQSMSLQQFGEFQEIYTICLDRWMENVPLSKAFSDLKYLQKRLFSPEIFGLTRPNIIDDHVIERESATIAANLGFFCEFKYMPAVCLSITPVEQST